MSPPDNLAAGPAPEAETGQAASGKRKWTYHAIGWIVSIACLAVIVRNVRIDEVLTAFENFHWPYVALGLISLMFGYFMRIVRWRTLLRAAGSTVSVKDCAAPFLGSIALNNVLPLRLGDVVRALVFPTAIGVPRTMATGSLIMERLVDLVTLLACLAAGMALTRGAAVPAWVQQSAVAFAALGVLSLLVIFLASGWLARMVETRFMSGRAASTKPLTIVTEMLRSFEAMSRPGVIALLFILSFLAWSGEAGVFLSLLRGFDLPATPGTALIVMAIVTLSTLAPSSPGYVGPFHLAAFAAISMLDGTKGQATSFAVLSHLTLWLPTTAAGGLAMLSRPELFRGLFQRRASPKSRES